MKMVVLLISLLFTFSSSCTSATTTPNQILQVVRDTNGEILKSDIRYFVIMPPILVGGGGVTRGPIFDAEDGAGDANFVCPFQVVQTPLNSDQGMAVYFKPKAPKQIEITESTSLNIKFYLDNPTEICNNTVWEVEGNFPGTALSPAFLSTNGGETGNPSKVNTWFQIKKFNDDDDNSMYVLVFCPNNYEESCSEITIDYVDGQRRLAVKFGYRFPIVFVKDDRYGINSIV